MIPLHTPRKSTLGAIGIAFLSLGITTSAQAAVLFNNGAPDKNFVVKSDFDLPVEAGDNFSLSDASNITQITWTGAYVTSDDHFFNTPAADNFSVRVFKILNGVPQSSPLNTFSNISASRTSTVFPGFTLFNYAFTPSQPFALNAGNYLLSVVNDTTAQSDYSWFWASSAEPGNSFGRSNSNEPWFQIAASKGPTIDLSFAVEGNTLPSPPPPPSPAPPPAKVPTPALLPGLIGLGLSVWRRRQAANRSTAS